MHSPPEVPRLYFSLCDSQGTLLPAPALNVGIVNNFNYRSVAIIAIFFPTCTIVADIVESTN